MTAKPARIRVFLSYSHRDEDLRKELERHLSGLRRGDLIEDWHDRKIPAGADWKDTIDEHLERAELVLLLVSADFLASDYCYAIEMKRALERRAAGQAHVVPIIVRDCDWQDAPIGKLQALPTDAKPITSWSDRDAAWTDVARGLRRLIGAMTKG